MKASKVVEVLMVLDDDSQGYMVVPRYDDSGNWYYYDDGEGWALLNGSSEVIPKLQAEYLKKANEGDMK